jgi:hypothetical protein
MEQILGWQQRQQEEARAGREARAGQQTPTHLSGRFGITRCTIRCQDQRQVGPVLGVEQGPVGHALLGRSGCSCQT